MPVASSRTSRSAPSRFGYGPLLLGGVQVFEYKASLMHAKTIVIDGIWSTIGSTNFDNRSFALNQEINLTVYDSGSLIGSKKSFKKI
ncbi:MAG TPA: phospholipase D-like domain-containing protein [Candidatus Binatia bacterium]|jgi:cardiolipin synthase